MLATASSVSEGKQLLQQIKPNVVFLDVELGDGTGMDLLQSLSEIQFSVIFITAFNKYAVDAFTFSAIDFLLKPFDVEAIERSVQRAENAQERAIQLEQLNVLIEHSTPNQMGKRLVLRDAQAVHYTLVSNILYCEAKGAYTNIVLEKQAPITVSKHLKEYEMLLNPFQFVRVHNSFLVNPEHVVRYEKKDGGFLVLSNGTIVPVSIRRKDDVLKGLGSF